MNKLVWIIIFGFVALIIIAAASSSGTNTSRTQTGRTEAKCKFTIYAAPQITSIMIQDIIYTNLNYINETAHINFNELPKSFNFGKDEVLSFQVTTAPGYTLNYWLPDSGRPSYDNPFQTQASSDFTLTIHLRRTTTP